jgi:Ni/Fe-hydrogenase subunit HybB-like protein
MSAPERKLAPPVEGPIFPPEELLSRDLRVGDVTRDVTAPIERIPGLGWWIAFMITCGMMSIGAFVLYKQLRLGIGVLGLDIPVGWGVYITNFVFWIGIGHAGTLISAILYLLRQRWRTAINRSAEAMTIFAVMTAGLFPLVHLGRTWKVFWIIPYPNARYLWVNFRSPLLWDVFAVTTYFTISLLFWYTGLVPDFATIRDKAQSLWRKKIYGTLSLGWTGSHRDWNHYEKAYLLFAGMETALVLSVHTVVSFDFASAVLPGWHTTIFPPYFVAGAIFSGFAMVITLLVIMRKMFRLEHLITIRHLELMCMIVTATGMMVGFSYVTEWFTAWYSNNPFERFIYMERITGTYAWSFWVLIACNALAPLFFFFKKVRTSIPWMFAISILVNIGMWTERFNIIVTSLRHDFLPSSWHHYAPSMYDWGMTIGAFGVFFTLFLLFVRVAPSIAIG